MILLFQIDLLLQTTIEGIKVFNWGEVKTLQNTSRHSTYYRGMGVYNFSVVYGVNNLRYDSYSTKVQ